MRCPSCSFENPAGGRYCGACGAPLVAMSQAPTEFASGDETLPTTPAAGAPTPPARPSSPAGRSGAVRGGGSLRSAAAGRVRTGGNERFFPGAIVDDRYRIIGLLGRGGMGEVYRADDLKLGEPVALKFLPASLSTDDVLRERFLEEARVARLVTHANVCRVFDIGEVEGQLFLSMEYVDGEDLASLLRRVGRLPEDRAVQVARQICAGLSAAHEQGVLHRDLKPSNVMIDGRGRARLTDFGLAGLAGELSGAERAGTPAYMAPEQFAGREVTVQSDLYALGLVLYELFTGRYAFGELTADTVSKRTAETTPLTPTSYVGGLDPAVERAILRCLEHDPARRPRSALSVAAALPGGDPLAAALAAGETPSPEMVADARPAEAMHPAAAAGLAVIGIVAFVAALLLAGHQQLRAFVRLEKSPPVLVDRAREMIRELGYDEPVYAKPTDHAFGFSTWIGELQSIEQVDSSSTRWSRLGAARRVVSFWYRQSPAMMFPHAGWGSFAGGRVDRWNPSPLTTGEMTVSIDHQGRLDFFACAPRRFKPDTVSGRTPDWATVFRLARLDVASLRPVEPRFQRYMDPDTSAAWLGRFVGEDAEFRIEAGMSEGRLVLFNVMEPWEGESLSSTPSPTPNPNAGQNAWTLAILALVLGAALVARHQLRHGRADRRGAARVAALGALLSALYELLRGHGLASLAGVPLLFPILSTMLFFAGLYWTFYVALEPWARRIWPGMLISWSRLMSGVRVPLRDPVVGRSLLGGLVAGSVLALSFPLDRLLRGLVLGRPPRPEIGVWTALLGTNHALSDIAGAFMQTLTSSFIVAFVLVLGRLLTRRPAIAIAIALAIFVIPQVLLQQPDPRTIGISLAIGLAANLVFFVVLTRQGLLAAVVANAVAAISVIAATADPGAWHAQPARIAIVLVVLLAAYAYWCAIAGRRLLPEERHRPATERSAAR